MLLLENQTTNTDGSQKVLECTGGQVMFQATGTFDGAIVTIQGSMHGFDFVDLTDGNGDVVSMVSPGVVVSGWNNPGFTIRASVTGVGTTDISLAAL